MGFFSELKEDLSQAVNELMPVGEEPLEQQETPESKKPESTAPETPKAEGLETSLEEMLKNIDEIEVPAELENKPETTDAKQEETAQEEPALEEMLAAALEAIPEKPEETDAQPEISTEAVKQAQTNEKAAGEEAKQEHSQGTREESKGAEKKMDSYASRQVSDETAVITLGMQIRGDIMSEGSVDVIGLVDGNIDILGKLNITGHLNGNSKAAEIYAEGAKITGELVSEGAVKIGDSSVIIGNITAKSAAIAGAVKGDIDVQGPVILDASAIVMGNIKSKSVQINNGAVIEGMCSQCYADVSPTSFFDEYKPDIKVSKKTKSQ
jgi:cytoskeletal protein CcmA (bactofilin family)